MSKIQKKIDALLKRVRKLNEKIQKLKASGAKKKKKSKAKKKSAPKKKKKSVPKKRIAKSSVRPANPSPVTSAPAVSDSGQIS